MVNSILQLDYLIFKLSFLAKLRSTLISWNLKQTAVVIMIVHIWVEYVVRYSELLMGSRGCRAYIVFVIVCWLCLSLSSDFFIWVLIRFNASSWHFWRKIALSFRTLATIIWILGLLSCWVPSSVWSIWLAWVIREHSRSRRHWSCTSFC